MKLSNKLLWGALVFFVVLLLAFLVQIRISVMNQGKQQTACSQGIFLLDPYYGQIPLGERNSTEKG